MELRELLVEYKNISLKLIEAIKVDNEPETLFHRREVLLNEIKQLTFEKEEFKALANELNLVEIEKVISLELVKVKEEIRKELLELKNKKAAVRGYGAQMNNINFLNTHI